jgi:hypothetical protein
MAKQLTNLLHDTRTRRFITAFTRACQQYLSWARDFMAKEIENTHIFIVIMIFRFLAYCTVCFWFGRIITKWLKLVIFRGTLNVLMLVLCPAFWWYWCTLFCAFSCRTIAVTCYIFDVKSEKNSMFVWQVYQIFCTMDSGEAVFSDVSHRTDAVSFCVKSKLEPDSEWHAELV